MVVVDADLEDCPGGTAPKADGVSQRLARAVVPELDDLALVVPLEVDDAARLQVEPPLAAP